MAGRRPPGREDRRKRCILIEHGPAAHGDTDKIRLGTHDMQNGGLAQQLTFARSLNSNGLRRAASACRQLPCHGRMALTMAQVVVTERSYGQCRGYECPRPSERGRGGAFRYLRVASKWGGDNSSSADTDGHGENLPQPPKLGPASCWTKRAAANSN